MHGWDEKTVNAQVVKYIMADNTLVDIKTGQPIKGTRQKTGQDAKRWRYLIERLTAGEYVLMTSGVDLVKGGYLDATISTIDEKIEDEYKVKKREEVRKRRGK